MKKYFFQVIAEQFTNGPIPERVNIRTFHSEKNAQTAFLTLCYDLCYPVSNVMEGNDDYILIAEAGGIDCDYRIMLTCHTKYQDKKYF